MDPCRTSESSLTLIGISSNTIKMVEVKLLVLFVNIIQVELK